MTHPLVVQRRFARSEWRGVTDTRSCPVGESGTGLRRRAARLCVPLIRALVTLGGGSVTPARSRVSVMGSAFARRPAPLPHPSHAFSLTLGGLVLTILPRCRRTVSIVPPIIVGLLAVR